MESRSLVTKAFLPSAQSTEVLSRLGDCLSIETNHDSAQFFVAMCDIKIDLTAAVSWPAILGGVELKSTLFVIFGPLVADEL